MPAFRWQALDPRGRVKKGLTEADSQSVLISQLRDKNLSPTLIEEVKKKVGGNFLSGLSFSRFGRISSKALFIITRQLATLLGQGIPVDSALATIMQQAEKGSTKNLLTSVRAKVVEGHTLSRSLSEFSNVFPDYYVYTVAAGEKTGNLPIVLESLADYLQSSYTSRQKIMLAMIYPVFIVVVAFIVVGVLLTLVVPDIVKVFAGTNQELPFITKVLIGLSNFLQENILAILVVILVLLLGLNFMLKTESGKMWIQKFLLKMPIYGKLLKNTAILRFVRTMSILSKSKVEITDAINISTQVVNVLPLKAKLNVVIQEVREGIALGKSLEKTRIFSPLLLSLIVSGEQSGSLSQMLNQGAEIQEQDLLASISVVIGVFEPVMILLMGVMVLIIVLAILVPIFDMNTMVR